MLKNARFRVILSCAALCGACVIWDEPPPNRVADVLGRLIIVFHLLTGRGEVSLTAAVDLH